MRRNMEKSWRVLQQAELAAPSTCPNLGSSCSSLAPVLQRARFAKMRAERWPGRGFKVWSVAFSGPAESEGKASEWSLLVWQSRRHGRGMEIETDSARQEVANEVGVRLAEVLGRESASASDSSANDSSRKGSPVARRGRRRRASRTTGTGCSCRYDGYDVSRDDDGGDDSDGHDRTTARSRKQSHCRTDGLLVVFNNVVTTRKETRREKKS